MNLPGPTSDAQLFYTELRPIQIERYDIAQIASPSARASIDSNHALPPPKTPIRSTGITIYKTLRSQPQILTFFTRALK